MGVSPQYINKIAKGTENLTLETISRLENVLNVQLIELTNNYLITNTYEQIEFEGLFSFSSQQQIIEIMIMSQQEMANWSNQAGEYSYAMAA
jgi:transcriptional regulator with XRE-family HTH domain